ncbi:hypothetical protein J2Z69_002008 [Paenibacillus shirakamiensis]|uniref:Heparinase n=1 Tax=Paenibacillus shirakamiensis TaxID=1265935 RepID=A0ABS4JIN5_9BACL|nr:alginate lyase family protein [Paenibacillus shirakamiensis]MBP2000965.1 hypothetical protein [Paenibacillus shirakamiensis]
MNAHIKHRPNTFFWNEADREFIVTTALKHWPDEVKEVLHRADLALELTFIFTHRWDMERCTDPVTFVNTVDWNYRHNEDLEWLVMLNRARYMGELGQAYWLTGDESYAAGYIRLMKDWIQSNALTEEELESSATRAFNVKDTWRKLDSGIRITHWLKGYYCIRSSEAWGEEEEQLFRSSVQLHGVYLSRAYTVHDAQSNWGYLETNGLLQLALLFSDLEQSQAWLKTAIARLTDMAKIQVFPDGMHNEQCTMYHHEVLHCLFESLALCQRNHMDLPAEVADTLNRMYSATLAFIQPNGTQPMLGDSDGTDVRDVLARGAVLFQRGDLKSQAYPTLDYDGLWYFGATGWRNYDELPAIAPAVASIYLEDSGYAFMRSDWSSDAKYLLFDAGHMDVIRAHGHDDVLHISLSAYGQEFLIDPGRYTYMENEMRHYFKTSWQHNTLHVDRKAMSNYVDSWNWKDEANPIGAFWRSHVSYDYAEASHDGYWKLESPVQVKRQIVFVKPSYWIVIDTCLSKDAHHYELPLHFAEGLTLTENQDRHELIATSEKASICDPSLRIFSLRPVGMAFEPSWVSRHYNEKSPAVKAVLSQSGRGITQFITLLYPERPNEHTKLYFKETSCLDSYGKEVTSDKATVIEIQHGVVTDTLLLSHQGPKGYQFAGVHRSGTVLLARQDVGKKSESWTLKI